jgi:hypothetical protein
MKTLWQTFLLVVIIFAMALIAEQIAPLKQFSLYLAQHPRPYSTIAIGLAVAGWVILGSAFVLGLAKKGQPMSEEGARQFAKSNNHIQHFSGQAVGREFQVEMSLRGLKDGLRSGAGWRNLSWWLVFLGLIGLSLAAYGMFGYFFVIGPPLVKLACAGALIYATFRTAWGFWKA